MLFKKGGLTLRQIIIIIVIVMFCIFFFATVAEALSKILNI